MRGRGRRGPSPLSRTYESNGPDVKIRGTAAHIAEKYMQLARDAQASGDPVGAENYFQHAEHYFRIIAAAQAQNPQQAGTDQQRPRFNGADDFDDEDDTTPQPVRGEGPQPAYRPQPPLDQPQPAVQHQPQSQPQAQPHPIAAPATAYEADEAEGQDADAEPQQPHGAAGQANGGQAPRRRRRRSGPDAAGQQAAGEPAGGIAVANGPAGHDEAAQPPVVQVADEGPDETLLTAGDA